MIKALLLKGFKLFHLKVELQFPKPFQVRGCDKSFITDGLYYSVLNAARSGVVIRLCHLGIVSQCPELSVLPYTANNSP